MLCGIAGAIAGCDQAGAERHYVGHVTPLTGVHRDLGQQALHGVQLAVEEANSDAASLVGGRKVAVIHADSASNARTAGSQAMRLATVNRVEALLSDGGRADAIAVGAAAREFNLVAFNTSGVADAPPPVVFAVGLSESHRAKSIDRFLSEALKPRTLAVVADGTDAIANQFVDEFVRLSRARNVEVMRIQLLQDGDLAVAAEKLRGLSGAIVVAAPAQSLLKLRAALVKHGALPDLIFAGTDSERTEIASADQAYFITAYAAGGGPAFAEFDKRFRAKFGTGALPQAAASYDAIRLLLTGARGAGGFSTPKLHEKLIELKSFEGLMGRLAMGPDRVIRGPSFVIQIVGGKEELKQRYEP